MLLGLYTDILENNHLVIPDQFREAYAAGLYITSGFDRNIMILTLQAFEIIYDKITALNLADPVARLLLRMILGSAHKVDVASNGKIPIPDSLKKIANLEQEVVIIGQGDFIEVWAPEIWNAQVERILQVESNYFSTLNLTTR